MAAKRMDLEAEFDLETLYGLSEEDKGGDREAHSW